MGITNFKKNFLQQHADVIGKLNGSNVKIGKKTQVLNYPFLYFMPLMGGIGHRKRPPN
jgi:hypothetical protein